MPGKQIAATVGCAEPTVATWRRRYAWKTALNQFNIMFPGRLDRA